MEFSFVLVILGVLFLLEGIVIIMFPKHCSKIYLKLGRSWKKLRNYGVLELALGVLIMLIGLSLEK